VSDSFKKEWEENDCVTCAFINRRPCLSCIHKIATKQVLLSRMLDEHFTDEDHMKIKRALLKEYDFDYDIRIIRNRYGDEGVSLYNTIKTWLIGTLKEWRDKDFNGIKITEERITPIIALGLLDGYKEFKDEGDK
jgi:hypothetical protein